MMAVSSAQAHNKRQAQAQAQTPSLALPSLASPSSHLHHLCSSSSSFSSSSSSSLSHSSSSSLFLVLVLLSLTLSSVCIPVAASSSVLSLDSSSSLNSSPSLIGPQLIQAPELDSFASSPFDSSPILVHLQQRAPPAGQQTTTLGSTTYYSTRSKSIATSTATNSGANRPSNTMSSPTPTPAPTKAPDSKGDTALFGKPSVIGSYNLTTGILIYSAFMILFLVAVGSATYRRAKYRNQFRQQQQRNMEGGRSTPGGKGATGKGSNAELSDAALFKQASISKRALMKDVGPGGVMAANELTKNRIAAANGAGRSYEERSGASQQSGQSIRFGESNGNNSRPTNGGTGRTGGMKKTNRGDVNQGGYEMNTYSEDSSRFYQDNYDTTDYSRPPLTESADPYYSSGGSSHSGYLDQAEEYHGPGASPQKPKAAYQHHQGQPSSSSTMSPSSSSSPQPQYSQPMFVQRTNSSRMPKTELHDGNNIFRSDSGRRTPGLERNGSGNGQPIRIATQGMLDRSGSSGPRSGATSPIDMGMSRAGSNASSSRTRVSPSPTQLHPTPIARSNSTRLPPSMRGAGTPQLSSNLSQQVNNYDYV